MLVVAWFSASGSYSHSRQCSLHCSAGFTLETLAKTHVLGHTCDFPSSAPCNDVSGVQVLVQAVQPKEARHAMEAVPHAVGTLSLGKLTQLSLISLKTCVVFCGAVGVRVFPTFGSGSCNGLGAASPGPKTCDISCKASSAGTWAGP